MTSIQCYTYFGGQRPRGWVVSSGVSVAPCLNWLVNRFDTRARVIMPNTSPGVELGKITPAQFGRLYMQLVPQDWDPLQTTTNLTLGRDIYTLWLNIPPKYPIPSTLRAVGVSAPGLYRLIFDTAQLNGVHVWGVFVPHWEDDRALKFGATWGGLIQKPYLPKTVGGGNL